MSKIQKMKVFVILTQYCMSKAQACKQVESVAFSILVTENGCTHAEYSDRHLTEINTLYRGTKRF